MEVQHVGTLYQRLNDASLTEQVNPAPPGVSSWSDRLSPQTPRMLKLMKNG